MKAPISTTTTKTQPASSCACGCAPCDQTCCALDCLVQPRYACGQMLTDADLTAGINWTKEKFRLRRFREGWGVICGLEVGAKPTSSIISVAPGYALSCCGDDIVVCEDGQLDLSQVIRKPDNPCSSPYKQNQTDTSTEPVVDVYICYREDPAAPGLTLGRAACGQAAECEYTRIKETFQLVGRLVTELDKDLLNDSAKKWAVKYDLCLSELSAAFGKVLTGIFDAKKLTDADDKAKKEQQLTFSYGLLRDALKKWLANHPCPQYPELHAYVNSDAPSPLPGDMNEIDLMLLLLQACRSSHLDGHCIDCDDSGVPLARVWLRAAQERGRTSYSVSRLDSYAPYRRLQQHDGLPAGRGQVNVADVIWHRSEEALSMLAARGLRVENPVAFDLNADFFNQLANFTTVQVSREKPLTPLVYTDPRTPEPHFKRIVGFRAQ